MFQLNLGDHSSPIAGYIAFRSRDHGALQWARRQALRISRDVASANVYFRSLPGGRSLTQILGDSSIWVNYHPTMPYFGETNAVGGREVAISGMSIRLGQWTVLATLIHELAHVNGAPGGGSQAAELAVLACGMGYQSERVSGVDDPRTPYNPGIGG